MLTLDTYSHVLSDMQLVIFFRSPTSQELDYMIDRAMLAELRRRICGI